MNLIDSFYKNKSEERAISMAAYQKNQFVFLGIPKPKRNDLQKDFIKEAKIKKQIEWDFIFKCWSLDEREFQYLAIDYLVELKEYILDTDIDKIKNLITTKSWWDTVDMLATNLVGIVFSKYPNLINKYISNWSKDDNIWIKRTAILFQLKYKKKTDAELLKKIILENKDTKEFFINKAIGWALREYSKTNKDYVREFVEDNKLSSLSVREASKYL